MLEKALLIIMNYCRKPTTFTRTNSIDLSGTTILQLTAIVPNAIYKPGLKFITS